MKKPKPSKHETQWCNRGFFPTYFGFCPSEKAWLATLKRMEIEPHECPYPESDGCCMTLSRKRDGRLSCLVTIADGVDQTDVGTIVGIISHEATHVWQAMREDMGEETPSSEFEAYTVQAITQQLFDAYCATRNPSIAKLKLKVPKTNGPKKKRAGTKLGSPGRPEHADQSRDHQEGQEAHG